ncbi:YggS family pyridoxal phosphate-dependent enzyme [candidate division KSB1 bacterium]|nr:YggS family pyridoxal phosphate-dependent enzyme [candidate division KSB1 bacterium]
MDYDSIKTNVREVLKSLPEHVTLVAAAKTRSADEVSAAIDAGIKIVGYNYVQEAADIKPHILQSVKWHMIGHLQTNKVKKAVELFDMIETVDSIKLADAIDRHANDAGKIMPILIEINSAGESSKNGISIEHLDALVDHIRTLPNIQLEGLMTMGAYAIDPDEARRYFRETKAAFDRLKTVKLANITMRHLSMGMSDSYKIAIEEGATMVRIGTRLFGERYK